VKVERSYNQQKKRFSFVEGAPLGRAGEKPGRKQLTLVLFLLWHVFFFEEREQINERPSMKSFFSSFVFHNVII